MKQAPNSGIVLMGRMWSIVHIVEIPSTVVINIAVFVIVPSFVWNLVWIDEQILSKIFM